MNQKVSKKEIWKQTVSPFVGFMYGLRVFFQYLTSVLWLILVLLMIENMNMVLKTLKSKEFATQLGERYGVDSEQISNYMSYIKLNSSTVIAVSLIFIVVFILITLWYHLGKSRVLGTFYFIRDCFTFLAYLKSFAIATVGGAIIGVSLLITILFVVADFLIMKSLFRYHKSLSNAIFKYNDSLRRASEKAQKNPEFHITKPKLDHVYYPMKDAKREENQSIPIDQYLATKENPEGGSVYQADDGKVSNLYGGKNIPKKKHKTQSPSARVMKELKSSLDESVTADSRYAIEDRPLLSNIKNESSKENENEQINDIPKEMEEKPEVMVEEVQSKEMEEKPEVIIEEVQSEEIKEEPEVVAEEPFSQEIEVEQEPVLEEVLETQVLQNEDITEDSTKEDNFEEKDGLKVDTSLGYRRITFDDL